MVATTNKYHKAILTVIALIFLLTCAVIAVLIIADGIKLSLEFKPTAKFTPAVIFFVCLGVAGMIASAMAWVKLVFRAKD